MEELLKLTKEEILLLEYKGFIDEKLLLELKKLKGIN